MVPRSRHMESRRDRLSDKEGNGTPSLTMKGCGTEAPPIHTFIRTGEYKWSGGGSGSTTVRMSNRPPAAASASTVHSDSQYGGHAHRRTSLADCRRVTCHRARSGARRGPRRCERGGGPATDRADGGSAGGRSGRAKGDNSHERQPGRVSFLNRGLVRFTERPACYGRGLL